VTGRSVSNLACAGCGWEPAEDEPYPFRCPRAGTDDTDHVVARTLDLARLAWPRGYEPNPFVRYRELLHAYHVARSRGMGDEGFVHLVERLDKEVAAVDGHGFAETPFGVAARLSGRLGFAEPGGVWVKDETGNVSGSHKARHLMGLLIYLEVLEETGLTDPGDRPDLAIASCGNAALAAAVVARAGGRRLRVFVPTWAEPPVVERLRSLGAVIEVCERVPGVAGDPTYHALQRAIAEGALPFTCQGNENGLAIEGGHTLGYEMAARLHRDGANLEAVFVQVGGGALASGVARGLEEAVALGVLDRMPRIHTVQTLSGHPLQRAFDRLFERVQAEPAFASPEAQEALEYARTHRSEFMWPWEEEPRSIAHGILDDETYDWFAVVRAMMLTGGGPIVVDEPILVEANESARSATGIDVDHTGSSGLAGVLQEKADHGIDPGERVGVLFTGVRR
jgi:threonine synthase